MHRGLDASMGGRVESGLGRTALGVLLCAALAHPARAEGAATPQGSWVAVAVGACDDPNLGADAVLVRQALANALGGAVLSSDMAEDRFGIYPPATLEQVGRGAAGI